MRAAFHSDMARLAPTPTSRRDDDPTLSPSGPYRSLKVFGLIVLCGAWVVLGLVGHDPWKSEDATSFGIVHEMLHGGDYITPNLAGEPFVDRPPLVYVLATLSAKLTSSFLPEHDAARLAAGLLLALTLYVLAATGYELIGRNFRWMPVLLFIGSVGLWDRAHQLSPELGLIAGIAVAQYGFALALRRPIAGGAVLGIGTAFAFLARGFMGPLWLALTAVVLPLAFAAWRTPRYATCIGVALVIALPLGAAWPVMLAVSAPADFAAWWGAQSWTDWFGPLSPKASADPVVLLKNLLWFAWPALPLAAWTLYMRSRGFNGGLATPAIELPCTLAGVMLVSIAVMSDPRVAYLMPLLLPLALLGAAEIDTLKRGYSGALDWFGILTFGLSAALAWLLWFDAYARGMSVPVATVMRDTEAGYRPTFHWLAIIVSALLTLLWLMLVRPARRSNRRAVLNWAAGMTLLWSLYSTIWLPYLDSRRSYRTVAQDLAAHLPGNGCVASRNLGESQRALFQYFGGLVTLREEAPRTHDCPTLLVQYGRMAGEPEVPKGYTVLWEGGRRGDDTERYVLYARSRR
jgi:4-amino-4-deoxy-L-arabinose transferase-like glycosyltransferase